MTLPYKQSHKRWYFKSRQSFIKTEAVFYCNLNKK